MAADYGSCALLPFRVEAAMLGHVATQPLTTPGRSRGGQGVRLRRADRRAGWPDRPRRRGVPPARPRRPPRLHAPAGRSAEPRGQHRHHRRLAGDPLAVALAWPVAPFAPAVLALIAGAVVAALAGTRSFAASRDDAAGAARSSCCSSRSGRPDRRRFPAADGPGAPAGADRHGSPPGCRSAWGSAWSAACSASPAAKSSSRRSLRLWGRHQDGRHGQPLVSLPTVAVGIGRYARRGAYDAGARGDRRSDGRGFGDRRGHRRAAGRDRPGRRARRSGSVSSSSSPRFASFAWMSFTTRASLSELSLTAAGTRRSRAAPDRARRRRREAPRLRRTGSGRRVRPDRSVDYQGQQVTGLRRDASFRGDLRLCLIDGQLVLVIEQARSTGTERDGGLLWACAVMDVRVEAPASTRAIAIDFLYLDLETCTRCRGTDANLEAALTQVQHILAAAGVEVSLRKTLVASAEQAQGTGLS